MKIYRGYIVTDQLIRRKAVAFSAFSVNDVTRLGNESRMERMIVLTSASVNGP